MGMGDHRKAPARFTPEEEPQCLLHRELTSVEVKKSLIFLYLFH